MNIKKTLAVVGSGLLGAVPAIAQESSVTVDTTAAGTAVDAMGTAISTLISGKITTNVLLIVGAGLTIAFIFFGVRYMLRAGKSSAK